MKELSTDAGIRSVPTPKSGRVEYRIKNAPGLYLRVSRRGKKWYLRARPPGEKNPVAILMGPYGDEERALTLKAAKAKAEQWREDIAGGGDPREANRKARDNTFKGVRETFLKRAQTALGEPWKDTTKAAYTSALEYPKLKKWETVPVVAITHANVQGHINALEEAGKYTSARRHLSYLKTFFAWCRRRKQGHIPPGAPLPTDGIELEKPRNNARRRELSPEEIKIFWRATQKLEYPWGPFYRMLLLTGQRLNEVAQLRRDDVKDGMWTQKANKADREHLVPLNDLALAELDGLPEHSEYYFSTRPDVPVSGFSKAKKYLDKQIAKVLEGGEMEHWTPHDLRRTMTTRLRELRISLHVCSRLLNHAERGVTAEHYDMYDMLDEKTQAMNTWSTYLARLLEDKQDNVVQMKQNLP
jgi:integrase